MAKAKHTSNTQRAIAGVDDPLVALGLEIERLEKRYHELDILEGCQNAERGVLRQDEMLHLSDRLEALRDYATTLHATSLDGAMLHIALASHYAESAIEQSESMSRSVGHKLDRLLFSVAGYLSTKQKDARFAGLVDNLMGNHTNPWLPYEERLAMIERSDESERSDEPGRNAEAA
jgi:hypothetical protein